VATENFIPIFSKPIMHMQLKRNKYIFIIATPKKVVIFYRAIFSKHRCIIIAKKVVFIRVFETHVIMLTLFSAAKDVVLCCAVMDLFTSATNSCQ